MSKARPRAEQAALFLAALAFAAYAFKIRGLGFYDDDWAWLAILAKSPDQGWFALISHFAKDHDGVWARPLNFPAFAALYKLFGAWALGWHLFLAALTAWGGVALWRWLEDEGLGRPTAVLAAGLFVLWPNHDATRHWVALYSAPAALALTFEALRLRKRSPNLSAHALLIGGLMYEGSALLAAVPVVTDAWRARKLGFWRAWLAGVAANVGPLTGLFCLVLWQRVLSPRLFSPERHPMSLSPAHFFQVFWTGLECSLLNRLWHLLYKHALWAKSLFSVWNWIAWAAASAVLAACARSTLTEESPSDDAPLFAAALFFFGYAPYVFDATYVPAIFSATNRVNFTGSAGAALFAAWGMRRLFAARSAAPRSAGLVLCAVLPAVCLLSTWTSNAQWAAAAKRQLEILGGLNRRLDHAPPGEKTILLFGLDTFIGSAPVFNSTYDLEGALYLSRREPGLKALVAEGRVSFAEKNAVMSWYGSTDIPYAGLYAYRADNGMFARVAGKADGELVLAAKESSAARP